MTKIASEHPPRRPMSNNQHDVTQHVNIDKICVQFERALRRGETPDVDELLAGVDESGKSLLLTQLLLVEFEHLERAGGEISLDDFLSRFPEHKAAVREAFQQYRDSPNKSGSEDQSSSATPPDATDLYPAISECAGTQIGSYKLLEQIGEGGMGVVYMAQQDQPVRRRVALKIIKPGMDTKQVVARFEAERQALAMMDHPNIAKVLDAGATESGRPYFVMELVKGVPITQYCDEHRSDARERLRLFATVCRAVQHAHQKGIIHRDLKPSNVLVAEYDHQPIPKIIDFGVAKATGQELTEKTLFTHFGQIVGTLDYMSPEQAKFNQLDIDTRSDIYSLGVLLFELLTGSTPIDDGSMRKSGLDEILRMIREDEPPRPSTRLSSSDTLPALAARRSTDPRKLARQLREDLDWIVVKALSKERSERYQTAEALADDIDNHLNDRPIAARRPSAVGRVRRYVRRHKTSVTLTSLAVAAATMAVTLGVIAYIGRINQEQQQTALKATRAQAEVSRLEAERKNTAREVDMPRVMHLLQERRHLEAFQLASNLREVLAEDPAFSELWKSLTVEVSLNVDPPGTAIYYRGARDVGGEWILAGESPLTNVRLPNTELRFRFTKAGYITQEFQRPFPQFTEWVKRFTLRREQDDPTGMVFVQGSQAASWNSLPTAIAPLFIDRYEVSNAEFQSFVDVGGYENPEFWSDLEFVDNGQTLSWEDAMDRFRDAGGAHGPAGWHGGEFPLGEDDYPVGGVSWFEAMAYAKFAEKSLPTIHHWKWAGRSENTGTTTALSNFSDRGPTPRGAQEGIGVFEVYDMAGNLKEWCFNEDADGRRFLMGGAWNESEYRFGFDEAARPWDRSFTNSFRCVRYLGESAPEALTLPTCRTTESQARGSRA